MIGRIMLHHVHQESIAIKTGVASETRTQASHRFAHPP
jgi:hypothetical protein